VAEIRLKSTGTIKLFESDNTSSVTIASPASLGGDRTITLPDASVTLASGTMLATDGSGASLTALNASELGSGTVPTARLGSGTASSTTILYGDQTYKTEPSGGGGMTQSSTWYVTTSYQPATDTAVIVNWAESNAGNYDRLGTSPTYSAGIFTLPATGWWMVSLNLTADQTSATNDSWGLLIRTSTNSGVDYDNAGAMVNRFTSSGATGDYRQVTTTMIVKCEDESTFRVQGYLLESDSATFQVIGGSQGGAGHMGGTYMNFMKLADV